MSDLHVSVVRPEQEADFEAWHRVLVEADRHALGDASCTWTLPELRLGHATPPPLPSQRDVGYAGRLGGPGGEIVCAGMITFPLRSHLTSAEVWVSVLPAHQRRGHGSAMLARLAADAAAEGRTLLQGEAGWAWSHGADPTGTPAHGFATAHGFELGLGDVQRVLRGQVPVDVLDALVAEAAERHEGYDVRVVVGALPDDLVRGYLALDGTLMTEAPAGTMTREAVPVDVDACRAREALNAAQGRTTYHALALAPPDAGDPAGEREVVAYSTVVTTVHEPGRAYQWGTLVRRDHRGHRLGLAVKAANHRVLQERQPEVDRVVTWNADENAHMIAVNERLGFVPEARLGEYEKRGA
ncbi:MAG: PE-PGRS family protein [Nocardioides sp.]|nr:PE-PGRS family protein [Nocardioides sp.]